MSKWFKSDDEDDETLSTSKFHRCQSWCDSYIESSA